MPFHEKHYDVFVILASPDAKPIWQWSEWSIVDKLFAPLMTVPRGKAALRGHRYVPNSQKPGYWKAEGIGRAGWDEKSHRKWTFASPETQDTCQTWEFGHVEAWAPSWTICEKENLAPDILLSLGNNRMSGPIDRTLLFNPTILLAASTSLDTDHRLVFEKAALALSKLVDSKLFAKCCRPWGYAWGTSGAAFTDSLATLITTGLFKLGDPHGREVNLETLLGNWEIIDIIDRK